MQLRVWTTQTTMRTQTRPRTRAKGRRMAGPTRARCVTRTRCSRAGKGGAAQVPCTPAWARCCARPYLVDHEFEISVPALFAALFSLQSTGFWVMSTHLIGETGLPLMLSVTAVKFTASVVGYASQFDVTP